MNDHMIDWQYFNPRFWLYRLWWAIMGGESIILPHRERTIVVEYGHPLWWDCGAQRVEVTTDNPMWLYGTWLEEHVGRLNRDWHIMLTQDMIQNPDQMIIKQEVEIQFRKGKEKWANLASLMWT
jgi:hypothetical protein